jgi:BirA family biotin operon repressor/biotin-[acetyl-CoA-carboxylase] ligase
MTWEISITEWLIERERCMRNIILKILLDNSGQFISGEEISNSLGVTRAAVWKYIKLLESEGYNIESVTGKGYRLQGVPDILDQVVITHGLNTKVLGQKMEIYESLSSTNARAKELALAEAAEGTIVLADEQLKGRGRLGRTWISPPGMGIWMSIILRPSLLPPQQVPRITVMTAVAVVRALNRVTGSETEIKWPNDIVYSGKKLCGILTEIHAEPEMIHYAVVGIGININLSKGDIPEDIKQTATSLKIEKGKNYNRGEIVRVVLEEIENIYFDNLCGNNFKPILEEYHHHSVILGKKVYVTGTGSKFFMGYANGFGEDGSLLLGLDDGRIIEVLAGDVSVRGLDGYV